jgi:uncharacterized protein YdeI (BOF family)
VLAAVAVVVVLVVVLVLKVTLGMQHGGLRSKQQQQVEEAGRAGPAVQCHVRLLTCKAASWMMTTRCCTCLVHRAH